VLNNILDLSEKNNILDAKYWSSSINQLYHPTAVFDLNHFDIVYSKDQIGKSKFSPILIKEWFSLVNYCGYLIIDYKQNLLCDWSELERLIWWLCESDYEIILHSPIKEEGLNCRASILNIIEKASEYSEETISEFSKDDYCNQYSRFIVKKTKPTPEYGSIESWTFGIITNGVNDEFVNQSIESIRKQNIPNYEIIICGAYEGKYAIDADCNNIRFNYRDKIGWITKKKNLIAQNAKHENLCIMHDRIYLDDNWYDGIKSWGNSFEVLTVPQLLSNSDIRFGDWVCVNNFTIENAKKLYPLNGGYCDYRDWDKDIPGGAAVVIIKKSIFQRFPFSEILYWDQYDDMEFHYRLLNNGFILRMNPNSIVYSSKKTVYDYQWEHQFSSKKLGPLKNVNPIIRCLFFVSNLIGLHRDSQIFNIVKIILKNRQNLINHKGSR
jgi:hypothetical protein